MKKQFILFSLLLICTFAATAQRGKMDPTKMAEKQTAALQERFTEKGFALDAETLEKVKAIHLKYGEQSKAVRTENKGDREAMRSAMEEVKSDQRKEIKALLSKDQFKEYKKMAEEQREKMKERRQGGPRGGSGF